MVIRYIFIYCFALLLITKSYAEDDVNESQTKVIMRMIGHEFLLHMDDSTSRVLPIEKDSGRFKIEFENEFAFEPYMLSDATFKVIEELYITDSYIVEIEKCSSHEVVHSFRANFISDSLTPCRTRGLPKDCYIVYFTIIENKKVEAETQKESFSFLSLNIILIVIGFGGAGWFFYRKSKKVDIKPNPNMLPIGKYSFDKKGMKLTLKSESVELSSKEVDLLFLLYSNENKTLERDVILNKVWGDEGDYVGRTLDVFISKLRKKLESDPSLKIINIRGVGYRFVMN